MVIFAEIVLFCLAIYLSIRFVTNEIRIKTLKAENEKLIEQNEELRELLLSDDVPTLEVPSHLVGKKILHG
jgi:hypothetical protein